MLEPELHVRSFRAAVLWGLGLAVLQSPAGVVYGHLVNKKQKAQQPLTTKEEHFKEAGVARYQDTYPTLEWSDLSASANNKLGKRCAPGSHTDCAKGLVCRNRICRHCIMDRECPSLHTCKSAFGVPNLCILEERMAWELAFTDPWECLCTVLIFFSSALAAASGTGGGGMFVPLLVLFSRLKTNAAVPLSQVMILMGSVMNLAAFCSQEHPKQPGHAKINYECVALFEPTLCLGVTLGVLLNQVSPQWLLLVLLCITLGMGLWRSSQKGFKQWKEEQKMMQDISRQNTPPGTEELPGWSNFVRLARSNSRPIAMIITLWLVMLLTSFHGMEVCTMDYLVFLVVLGILLVLCTWVASSKPSEWTEKGRCKFPLIAFGAGTLGGLLGLGGGIILSPVLLEVGLHSEAVQATTALFVFVSSSLATVQFAIMKMHVWHYAIWYSAVAVTATLLGQYVCDIYVRKHKRYSAITLSIAAVLLVSMVALCFVGVRQVSDDLRLGGSLGFSTTRLCRGQRMGIVTVDIVPAQAWPSDLPAWVPGFQLR